MKLKDQIQELEARKDEWTQELSKWSEKDLIAKEDANSWNALQILEHLIVSEAGTLRYLSKKTKAPFKTIPPTLMQEIKNSEELNGQLKSDKKYRMPAMMAEPRGLKTLSEQLEQWEGLRKKYDVFLKDLDKDYYDRLIFKHPYAGRLNLAQTMDFLSNHLVHHKHQLNRLKKTL